MGGVFVGCMIWGWASDKFGRRLTMLVAAVIQVVSSILAAFSPNYIIFIFLRFLIAFSVSGVFECGFVLVTEICGPSYRTYFGILTQFPFGWGAALLPVIAYFIRQWQNLQLAISVPCILLGIFYWTIPESPRWLMAEGRFDEALKILKDGAKTNKKQLPSDDELMEMMRSISADEEDKEEEKVEVELTTGQKILPVFDEIFVLVKTPEIRKRTLLIFFSWLIVAMVYYGLSLNSKNLGGDRYLNGFLSGFVEVPAVVVIIPLLSRLGRVKCYSGTFIAGGICCMLTALVTILTSGQGWAIALSVAIGIIGKFLISMTFAIAYLYTAELFPTKVRNLAVGLASTFARIGSISAPYIVDLLGSIHAGIPVVIFGLCSFAAGITSLMLPETLNKKMPESVAEIERSGKQKKESPEQEEMNAVSLPAETKAEGGE
jgi:OCT family organic cation transporter-like MFS transporter 4/5